MNAWKNRTCALQVSTYDEEEPASILIDNTGERKVDQTVAVSAVSITQTDYDKNSNELTSTNVPGERWNKQTFPYCTVNVKPDGLDDEDYNE